jgi:hypothetical protein
VRCCVIKVLVHLVKLKRLYPVFVENIPKKSIVVKRNFRKRVKLHIAMYRNLGWGSINAETSAEGIRLYGIKLTTENLGAAFIPARNGVTLRIWRLSAVLDLPRTSNSVLAENRMLTTSPTETPAKILSLYATNLAGKHFHVVTNVKPLVT